MSAPTLAQLVDAHGGVAFSLGLDRPRAGAAAIRRLAADDPALSVPPLDVQLASNEVRRGQLFAALPGLRTDGWSYARDAFARVVDPADRQSEREACGQPQQAADRCAHGDRREGWRRAA